MNATAIAAMTEASEASDAERLTFPQVVKLLMDAGVERYHTDMMRGEKTYYMPDGESHIVPGDKFDLAAPAAFSAAGVEAAVRAIQQGKIQYREFCRRIVAAGCVGYFVTILGRRAVYYGRTGDVHVEHFPQAK